MRTLALDWGEKRIGVALSNSQGTVSTPYGTIENSNDLMQVMREVRELVDETETEIVVLSWPKSMSGNNNQATKKMEEIFAALDSELPVTVEKFDERLTTVSAHNELKAAGLSEKQRRSVIDQVAASVMLQAWLDSHSS